MRLSVLAALVLISFESPAALGQTGMRDRYFTRYPFEQWKTEGAVSQLKWSPKVLPARLSTQQRLVARVEAQIDSKELAKRRGRGELVILMELADSAGRRFRTHETFDLSQIPANAAARPIQFGQNILVTPGQYELTLAVCDSKNLEHSLVTKTIHVAPLHNDPLNGAWRDLPPVEFMRNYEPPDSWFQPYLRGKLWLPVTTSRPVHIDLMVNLTGSDRTAGSLRSFRRNMSVLVPSLKLVSGMTVQEGTLDITLLDLSKQEFREQRNAHGVNWAGMREPFASANPATVDVHSLAARAAMRRFFRDQLLEKLKADREKEPLRVIIVLGAPVFLEKQEKLEPAPLQKDPGRKLFYIRYRPILTPRNGGPMGDGIVPAIASDDLEGIIHSLDGRTFPVQTPEDFRKALATIIGEISRM